MKKLEILTLKIKLMVLWMFIEVVMLSFMMVSLMEPGVIDELMSGVIEGMKIGPGLLLIFAIFMLIPPVMAFLSLTLKGSTNRWVNIIMGIFFTGFDLIDVMGHMTHPSAHIFLMGASLIVAPTLIAWYAWKWPKQEA
jgi:hypothetical protein